ncbi:MULTISPECIES: phosphotransferase family protein [Achromobacter]|uniref:Phosphotransferase family protein n=1 Tax=Achromobacter spanius TaxID=217203 RepID=A0ABY8GRP2_9BURK|nr:MULTISPECIES: phosphotransferase family protein [Achromobacter]WAI83242.1 phosphotransferase family protein [Achromobacter spanius]WEX93328.1 phosphotransferase family protein [Achromobacter sp. SS2-2022]WFP07514.1 phosphotransferase family protein [Achromobacter spanius]
MSAYPHSSEAAPGHAPDWLPALAAYLSEHGLCDAQSLRVRPLTGGQSNPTYLLEDKAGARVLRKQPPGALLPSAHAIDREYRVMAALAGTDVPVPRMLHYCADADVLGTPFYLMSYARGRVFMDPALPGLEPAERGALYVETGRVLATLHAVDPAAVGLADYGRAGDFFARQVARWTRQYRDTETAVIPAMDALIDWLPRHLPTDDQTRLVHGDYRIDNLVFDPLAPRAIALLDWELSTLGHPMADLAYHCMCWRIPPSLWRGIAGLDLAALGIPSEAEFVRSYCRARGIAPPPNWDFYLAYSFFRIAAILQGVYARALAGNAAAADGKEMGARVAPLAGLGWDAAQRESARLANSAS